MKLAVRYSSHNEKGPRTIIVEIDDNTRKTDDDYWGAASDQLDELEIQVKWHNVLGTVKVSELELN